MRPHIPAARSLSVLLVLAGAGGGPAAYAQAVAPPSPLILRDAVTISVDSSGSWPEDGITVAESYEIPVDWGSYSAQPYVGYDPVALAAKVAEVHQRGQLYLQYLTAGIVWDGPGAIADRKPELLDYVAIDIDGQKIVRPFGDLMMYRANMNEEGWREFLRSEMAAAIDAGADGFVIDDIQAQTLEVGGETGGTFNAPDMRGFREFLKAIYPPAALSSRFGIDDIDTFDYREYIVARGLAGQWRSEAPNVPLFNPFRTYQYQSTLAAYAELFGWARSYSLSRTGKPIVFLGNTSTGGDLSLPFEHSLDLAWLEFPYLTWGYPPRSKTIPATKLKIDDRWKKGTFLTQVPTNGDLAARGSPANLSKVLFAEAHAAKAEYQVPYEVVGGPGGIVYSPDLRELAPYYQFLARHRRYFGREWMWRPQVAILYPVAAYTGEADGYYGAALALLEAGVQFDALVSGDGRMFANTVTLDTLRQYPLLVLASPGAMSAAQVELVLAYLSAGGYVLTWGSIGEADELGQLDVQRPSDWRTVQTVGERRVGEGTVHNLSPNELGREYFRARDAATRTRIVDAVAGVVTPDVAVGQPEVVALTYQHSSAPALVVHLVNYNYDIDSDSVTTFNNLAVTFRPPAGFSLDGMHARLLSPDFAEADDVPYDIRDGIVFFDVPRLAYYGVLVVEPAPAAARQ